MDDVEVFRQLSIILHDRLDGLDLDFAWGVADDLAKLAMKFYADNNLKG